MNNGQKLKLGDDTPCHHNKYSRGTSIKAWRCLGHPPSSSIKISGLSRHFVFIVSCTVVLFLEHLSFHFLCLVCLVCLSSLDPRSRCVVLQISCLVLERSSKFLLEVQEDLALTVTYT